jgi:hypothetical protein
MACWILAACLAEANVRFGKEGGPLAKPQRVDSDLALLVDWTRPSLMVARITSAERYPGTSYGMDQHPYYLTREERAITLIEIVLNTTRSFEPKLGQFWASSTTL